MPTLESLFAEIPTQSTVAPVEVSGIAFDSRAVEPGNVFVALVGGSSDGHHFISAAVERGAVAVIGTQALGGLKVPYIQVEDTRQALAFLAAAFYAYPARKLAVIGVTGTDGKTTTSNLIFQILKRAGIRAGMISTVSAVIGDDELDTGFHVTTQEAPDVQRYLAGMVRAGLTHVVLESTSHGLAQDRVTACEFDIGVITNITHEHLDYHGSYEAYRASKARLFSMLAVTHMKPVPIQPLAVLNKDDSSYDYLAKHTAVHKIAYSQVAEADLVAKQVQQGSNGLQFRAAGPGFNQEIHSPMLGDFNVSNILAALGATVIGLGIDPAAAAASIAEFPSVHGRMERLDLGQNFTAIVDFAHTPNALKNALEAVRPMTTGRVIAVFGSAGLRDREKRRMMAEVAADLADFTILTAEDPRTESLDAILAEMAAAAGSRGGVEGQSFWRVRDRGQAIRLGVQMARSGDVVIACGKGHEQSMCFGVTEYAWDDRTAMRAALAELLNLDGPEMPYLPTREPHGDSFQS